MPEGQSTLNGEIAAAQSAAPPRKFTGAGGLVRFSAKAVHATTWRIRQFGVRALLRDLPLLLREGMSEYRGNDPAETEPANPGRRPRDFNLQSLLACPACGSGIRIHEMEHTCGGGAHRGTVVEGTPHFHRPGAAVILRMTEPNATHPYGDNALELLRRNESGLVLDFGAGNTPDACVRSNIVYMDVQQFRHTDVVVTTERLPFRDGVFDLVISQAVFEHVEDPHGAARELLRILKPGGTVYIDTAFLQPLHADPCHYFNMTLHGIRKVFAGFEEVRSGVAPYQNPSFGWLMQIEQALPDMAPGYWKDQLTELRKNLRENRWAFDDALGARGREMLAAGYFYEGRKPGASAVA